MTEFGSAINWLFILVIIVLAVWCYILKKRCDENEREIYSLKSRYDLLRKWATSGITSYREKTVDYKNQLSKVNSRSDDGLKVNYRSLSPIPMHEDHDNTGNPFFLPDDVSVGDSGKLISGYVCKSRPFGDYTVFVSPYGHCYHSISYCSHTYLTADHIMNVIDTKKPCTLCCGRNYPTKKPQWYRNYIDASRSAEITWTK